MNIRRKIALLFWPGLSDEQVKRITTQARIQALSELTQQPKPDIPKTAEETGKAINEALEHFYRTTGYRANATARYVEDSAEGAGTRVKMHVLDWEDVRL